MDRADERLGYTRYVARGGDWGNAVTEQMALLTPPGLLGVHTNMPATVPNDVQKALDAGGPPLSGLSADEKRAWDHLDFFFKNGVGYAQEMSHRPQTLYALEDSPVGPAAWMLDHDARSYALIAHVFNREPEGARRHLRSSAPAPFGTCALLQLHSALALERFGRSRSS